MDDDINFQKAHEFSHAFFLSMSDGTEQLVKFDKYLLVLFINSWMVDR